MDFSYTYGAHDLTKLIFLKKIHICSFDPTLSMYKVLNLNF
jgi:hypothetical protein